MRTVVVVQRQCYSERGSQFWLADVEVPFAFNADGELVEYQATLTKPARCSGCKRPVITRVGSHRAKGDLAHKPDGPGGGGGSCEGYEHRTAVLLVALRWRELEIRHACAKCGSEQVVPLPDAVEARREEIIRGDDGHARPLRAVTEWDSERKRGCD
jgi:hypothetical protein